MMADKSQHIPVLLEAAIDGLAVRPGGSYIDGTFGGGGHSARLSEAVGPQGTILAFDRDADAFSRAEQFNRPAYQSVIPIVASFATMAEVARARQVDPVDGVLLDLGISSIQLDDPGRGFSFLREGPLDMRMDPSKGESAASLVNRLPEEELARIFFEYGEERQARRIARAINNERTSSPIQTTVALASLVERAIGRRPGARIHPATRTFQALRIAVNDEFAELELGLKAAVEILGAGGRLVVISFHSLEDRIVKRFIAREVKGCICPPDQPVCTCDRTATLKSISKPVRPSQTEIELNPRARSAIMRIAERLL